MVPSTMAVTTTPERPQVGSSEAPGRRFVRSPGGGPTTRRMVVRAAVIALVGAAVTCVLLALSLENITQRVAGRRAVERALRRGEVDSQTIFTPYVTDDALAGVPAARIALDAVTARYLRASGAVRFKIWTADQRVAFSDEHRLIGRQYVLAPDELAAFETGRSAAEMRDLSRPENEFDGPARRLLEVYVPGATDGGRPVLFEMYFPLALVQESERDIRAHYLPLLVAVGAVLALIQVPGSIGLSLRLQRTRHAKAALLARLLSVSDAERRRVAGEIHDGAVQDLIGLGYALGGIAERASAAESEQLRELSDGLTTVVGRLRQLLTAIYPTAVGSGDLDAVVTSLASGLRRRGVEVTIDIHEEVPMNEAEEAVVLRTISELLHNIETHSEASMVSIRLSRTRRTVDLEVSDNGSGFEWSANGPRHTPGHFGLRLISDLARDSGGSLAIAARPGHGTTARLTFPSDR